MIYSFTTFSPYAINYVTLLSRKNLTSTSLMASIAAFILKQMYTVNLLNLMSADTEMEDSRIMIFFLRGAPLMGLYFAHNVKHQRSKALTTGRPSSLRLECPNFCLKS